VAERRSQTVKTVFFPHVHDARPSSSGSDHTPNSEAQLATIISRHRTPVRRHVVHVIRPVGPDDVDELVCVDLGVHDDSIACGRSIGEKTLSVRPFQPTRYNRLDETDSTKPASSNRPNLLFCDPEDPSPNQE
jgi:hypothetical protein